MTRADIEIIRHAIETVPNHWTYDGEDAESWDRRGQDATDTQEKDQAYLIAGTLQLMNDSGTHRAIERTPAAEARLTASKPDQTALDAARLALHWLADHAQYFPDDWATIGDPQATEATDKLRWAANACGAADALITTTAEEIERDDHHARRRQDQAGMPEPQ